VKLTDLPVLIGITLSVWQGFQPLLPKKAQNNPL
jgi:hypothetical protein